MLAAQRGLYLSGKESAYGLAETYAALDDERDAMIYVAISVSRHETDAIALRVDPPFSALRNDSRFVALMSKAGLVTLSSARARWIRASHS
jgi:hypothetical protein